MHLHYKEQTMDKAQITREALNGRQYNSLVKLHNKVNTSQAQRIKVTEFQREAMQTALNALIKKGVPIDEKTKDHARRLGLDLSLIR